MRESAIAHVKYGISPSLSYVTSKIRHNRRLISCFHPEFFTEVVVVDLYQKETFHTQPFIIITPPPPHTHTHTHTHTHKRTSDLLHNYARHYCTFVWYR